MIAVFTRGSAAGEFKTFVVASVVTVMHTYYVTELIAKDIDQLINRPIVHQQHTVIVPSNVS